MKSQLLNTEKQRLKERRVELVELLVEAEKEHKLKERTAQLASSRSMNVYYRVKELKEAIERIDEAIGSLDSAQKEPW